MTISSSFDLANGTKIPAIGFGTWQSADGQECYDAVLAALRAGYRHIDTAAAYGNEESVGRAIADFLSESGCSRGDLFVTTKLWNSDHGYEQTKKALDVSLKKLALDYADLYLIHWPNPLQFRDCWKAKNAESWKAMEEALGEGKLRAIGIAYSPLGTGGIFSNDFMKSLAEKYKKSIAQICRRWSLQKGFLPLPKSVTPSRIAENAAVFDFAIDDSDCEKIGSLTGLDIKQARNPDEAPF